MHLTAVASRGILVEINRGVGQIPDAIAVAVALSHEISVLRYVLVAHIALSFAPVTRARACGMP